MSEKRTVNHLGIIPARGGSKGVPLKNIKMFCGEPLIFHSIRSARESKLDDFFVSTDCEQIANIAAELDARPDFMRPSHLAEDSTNIISVLQHVVEEYENSKNAIVSNIYLLQPTSPWREARHIDEAIALMVKEGTDSVCSVVDASGIHPFKMKKIQSGLLSDFIETGLENPSRQSLPQVYNVNGCVYAVRREVLMTQSSLKGNVQKPLLMGPESAISIDTMLDFQICEFLFRKTLTKKGQGTAFGDEK